MNKIDALNDIEMRLQDIIQLMRALYPNFNSVYNAEGVMNYLNKANGHLSHLQEAECELSK